jgi:hypothetical protein
MILRQLYIHIQKNENRPFSHPYIRNNSKLIKDLNVKPETITLLEESIMKSLHDVRLVRDFLNIIPRAQAMKKKWNCTKLKNFCIAKERINKETTHRLGQDICKSYKIF